MLRKIALSAMVAGIASIMSMDGARAEIPDIDSSGWAVDPMKFGMSARDYIHAETHAFLADFIDRVGLNTFYHFPGLSTAEDKWVVSPNNDTIYSLATVNAREGFTLVVPDVGDRFLSIQIGTEDHVVPFYLYGGGTYKFSGNDFATDYVSVGIRTGTDGTPEDVAYVTGTLQPQYKIEGALDADNLSRPNVKTMLKVRAALIPEYDKLESTLDVQRTRTEDVDDWERYTYVTAGALGLSPDENAMYKPYALPGAVGGKCYKATFPKVPAHAFFSVTVYGSDKFLMSNADNIVSSNRKVVLNDDGSFTVAFGDESCRHLAPNYAYTPKDGWSLLIRAYRPDVEAFSNYKIPTIEPVE